MVFFKLSNHANLTCDECIEMVSHNQKVLNEGVLGVRNVGWVPRLSRGSPLKWYPALVNVCVFPIQESLEEGVENEESGVDFSRLDPHRPLFYTELNSAGFIIIKRRYRLKRDKRWIQFER